MYWASMHGSTLDGVNLREDQQPGLLFPVQRQCLRRIFQQESRREESMKINKTGVTGGYDGNL